MSFTGGGKAERNKGGRERERVREKYKANQQLTNTRLRTTGILKAPFTAWNIYGIAQDAATADGKSPSDISRKIPDSVSNTPTAAKMR